MRLLPAFLLLAASAAAHSPGDVPDDCSVALYIDIAALSKTEMYKKVATQLAASDAFKGFADLCKNAGAKAEDVTSVTIGLTGDDLEHAGMYAAIHGNFDPDKLAAHLTGTGDYEVRRMGKVILGLPTVEGAEEIGLADGTLFVAPPGKLSKFLGVSRKTAPASQLSQLLNKAGPAPVRCAVACTPAVTKSLKDLFGIAEQVSAIEFRMSAAEGVAIDMMLKADTEAAAKRIHDVIKADFDRSGFDAKLTLEGSSVSGTLKFTNDAFAQLLSLGLATGTGDAEGKPPSEGKDR